MLRMKSHKLDIVILLLLIIGNVLYHLFFDYLSRNKIFLANVDAIYEKIRIGLTTTSILLAGIGFFISSMIKLGNLRDHKNEMVRTFAWFVVALFSGVISIAIMPHRLHPSNYLESKHAVFWIWTYITGPIMFSSLIIGTVWFLIMIYKFIHSSETKNE